MNATSLKKSHLNLCAAAVAGFVDDHDEMEVKTIGFDKTPDSPSPYCSLGVVARGVAMTVIVHPSYEEDGVIHWSCIQIMGFDDSLACSPVEFVSEVATSPRLGRFLHIKGECEQVIWRLDMPHGACDLAFEPQRVALWALTGILSVLPRLKSPNTETQSLMNLGRFELN